MQSQETKVSEDLHLQMLGLVPKGKQHHRNILFDELYDLLPKDPSVRVSVYTAEIIPGGRTNWHLHNGVAFFLVLQGRIIIEFQDHSKHYKAGDVYSEPIGKIHRAFNPDGEVPFLCVGFIATPPDREHVVNVKEP